MFKGYESSPLHGHTGHSARLPPGVTSSLLRIVSGTERSHTHYRVTLLLNDVSASLRRSILSCSLPNDSDIQACLRTLSGSFDLELLVKLSI